MCLHEQNDSQLTQQIVDKREVELKSARMEKVGLVRAIDSLQKKGVNVVELVTDASTSVIALLGINK